LIVFAGEVAGDGLCGAAGLVWLGVQLRSGAWVASVAVRIENAFGHFSSYYIHRADRAGARPHKTRGAGAT
jgi:hypothetical protein